MLDRQIKLSADALFQDIGGEGVILDLNSASYFGLDEVGARLWSLLQTDASMQRAFEALQEEYDVDPDRLAVDLNALLDQLLAVGLVTVA